MLREIYCEMLYPEPALRFIVNIMLRRFLSSAAVRFALAFCGYVMVSAYAFAIDFDDPAWREFLHAMGDTPAIGANSDHRLADSVTRPIPAITAQEINIHKFLLGNDLFHERRLSSDSTTGCISCHAGPGSGTDGRPISLGVNRARGRFNSLTTFNAGFNFRQFWDGRSVTLADQALDPIISEREMANTLDNVLTTLQDDASYVASFSALYPDGLSVNNLADAMSHFQAMHFNVSDSPFQRHLNNDAERLSEPALRGWQTFQEVGCSSCHNGINLGGNSYQRLGSLRAYYPEERDAIADDLGLAERSLREQDMYVVKVPNLHNVAMTRPYFHDGNVATLETAVELMARYQLGRELSEQDINDISEFLRSLTGRPAGFALGSEIGQLARSTEPQQHLPTISHADAYRAAAMSIEPANQQLLVEMQNVAEGKIAHFDFVQYQHLELIRYARALRFPPSDLSDANRTCLATKAEQLLDQVMSLEWPIADYLRAQAMMGVMRAHQSNPALESPEPESIQSDLATYDAAAAQSLTAVVRSPVKATADSFSSCYP